MSVQITNSVILFSDSVVMQSILANDIGVNSVSCE